MKPTEPDGWSDEDVCRLVLAWAIRISGDSKLADEIGIQVAAAILERMAGNPPLELHTPAELKRYACRSIRRALKHRHDKDDAGAEADAKFLRLSELYKSESDAPDVIFETWEIGRNITAAMAELNPRQREAVICRHEMDFGYAEIGARLGLTETAARAVTIRGTLRLRKLLAEYRPTGNGGGDGADGCAGPDREVS